MLADRVVVEPARVVAKYCRAVVSTVSADAVELSAEYIDVVLTPMFCSAVVALVVSDVSADAVEFRALYIPAVDVPTAWKFVAV